MQRDEKQQRLCILSWRKQIQYSPAKSSQNLICYNLMRFPFPMTVIASGRNKRQKIHLLFLHHWNICSPQMKCTFSAPQFHFTYQYVQLAGERPPSVYPKVSHQNKCYEREPASLNLNWHPGSSICLTMGCERTSKPPTHPRTPPHTSTIHSAYFSVTTS